MQDLFDLTGKVALVTGGSRGLGYEMALGFARAGADVIVASRKLPRCEEVATQIRALGRRATAIACHVGQWIELERLVDVAYREFGKVDILVNNAGMSPVAESSLATPEELFDKIVAVNLKGPFRLAALVGSRMVQAGHGCIINVTSTAAIRPLPQFAPYAAAKAGLNVITRAQALEFGPLVRVNAIMAGPFWTDVSREWREEADRTSDAALRRIGRAHEIVTTALYLASDHSSFTTGSIIELSGGIR
ncbi:MAG: glucose 1-dehydrogenase [Steroidobacteraceae bacterium]|nr:glucose 1-dehydrogenase [Steroidobacteraceae bacterium]MDW8260668.1 glucose 1-dehydrogenase [Gammaproteobacteria bacterium]